MGSETEVTPICRKSSRVLLGFGVHSAMARGGGGALWPDTLDLVCK